MAQRLFSRELAARQPAARPRGRDRTWCYLPYDQLHGELGLLGERAPQEVGVVLIEHPGKAARRPYHRQKLALVIANQRQFALELAARGVAVRHVVAGPQGYAGALRTLATELGPLVVHEPAERELRRELAPLFGRELHLRAHDGWLTTAEQLRRAHGLPRTGPLPAGARLRMDRFYRQVRHDTGILMERGKPVGGKLSFDQDNRLPYRGQVPAPSPPRFVPDPITCEVGELIERAFASHPGQLDLSTLPTTLADAERLWAWALAECLPTFGPYEDAMSRSSSGLFHTRISALLNLHRLLPRRVLADALAAPIPLASKEGFVRQILGWRELVRHVHRETDGFRELPPELMAGRAPPSALPSAARTKPALPSAARRAVTGHDDDCAIEPGATPSLLGASRPLPPAYWGQPAHASGLACLDQVVADVWREAYSHHITRLMVLGNLAALLDVSPRQLTDWFWVAYTDAFDWVVEPNVLGMATFAVGDLMTTKPYIAGAAYLDRMSDYCTGCAFHPKKTCPITPLYWAYLDRHQGALRDNPRLTVPLAALRKRSPEQRARDAATFARVSATLCAGQRLVPDEPGTRQPRLPLGEP